MFGHQSYESKSQHGGWDLYGGPQELIEPGFRGFLITTLPGKEEFAVDDTISLLRQASIKTYGGVKITSRKLALCSRYLCIDFMDPTNIKLWPTPEGEDIIEEEKEKEKSTHDEGGTTEATDAKAVDSKNVEEATEKTNETQDESEVEKISSDNAGNETKVSDDSKDRDESKSEDSTADQAKRNDENKDRGENRKDSTSEKSKRNDENKDEIKSKDNTSDQAKKETGTDKSATTVTKRKQFAVMRSIYKFKAFRTESRNVMFIKSDVPDPMALAEAAMDLLIERKRVYEDGACQLLPVLGVCNFDLVQLEVMSRRVLSSIFSSSDEPKNFSVMVLENLPGPSTENVLEIVRNTIWSLNPLTWQTSPLTEPDVLIQIDLVGSKLVMCCVSKFMHYRYYSPNLLVKLGPGDPEDDDGTWLTATERKQQEEMRLAREKQKEFEKQRQEDFRKERERRRIQLEERKKLQLEERKKAKSRAAERKESKNTVEKQEGSNKKESEVSEDMKDLPPSKKPKLEVSEENQNSLAPDEISDQIKAEPAEPEKATTEESQQSAPDEDLNAEVEDPEEMDTSMSDVKEKTKQNKKRARGPRGGRSRSKK